jgi:hypothetical protein
MAKKQTRRSISVQGLLYQRLGNYCRRTGKSRSGVVTELLKEFLDLKDEPEAVILLPTTPRPKKKEEDEFIGSGHFSF